MLKFVGVACALIAFSAVIGYASAGKKIDTGKQVYSLTLAIKMVWI